MTQRFHATAPDSAARSRAKPLPLVLLTSLLALGAGLLLATSAHAGTVTAKVLDANGKPVRMWW